MQSHLQLYYLKQIYKRRKRCRSTNFIMGLAFITEGAIPFAASDPASCTSGMCYRFRNRRFFKYVIQLHFNGTTCGIFVFPVVGNPWMYLAALVVGTIVSTVLLGILKKKVEE